MWLAMGPWIEAAEADDGFLDALSKIATREARKQLRAKKFKFSGGPFAGTVEAVDPDGTLTTEVKDFALADDLLKTTVTASGRFRIEGQLSEEAEVSALFNVQLTANVEARFLKEDQKFYVEPTIKDISLTLSIVELSPANLSGGQELLSNLAMAAFSKSKDRIIAEANKRLGKRPI
jgi:hypothetical protein